MFEIYPPMLNSIFWLQSPGNTPETLKREKIGPEKGVQRTVLKSGRDINVEGKEIAGRVLKQIVKTILDENQRVLKL